MKALSAKTRAEAWLKGALELQAADERIYNLILEINQPGLATPASREIERNVVAFLRRHGCQPVHTVAETIFPAAEYRKGGIAAVFAYPSTVYPVIQPVNRWGTYALRMTQRKCSDGSTINPLEFLIEKLRRQLSLNAAKRAVYELDSMSEALDLKLYDADADRNNAVAGQCLSHLSFKLGPQRELYLTAMYRYQWFVQKALGNLLGLARLQDCVARELAISAGPLVCHATLAVLEDENVQDVPWNRSDLASLLAVCKQTPVEMESSGVPA